MNHTNYILASKSPRRKHLLELANIQFEIITEDTVEDFPDDLEISKAPVFIAKNKANAVFLKNVDRTIIAADTVVVLENKIIGKPKDRKDAIEILSSLSGKTHEVITGVVVMNQQKTIEFSDKTSVSFHPLTQEHIVYYVDTFKPYDKAGAYAIQEWIGAVGIQSIQGCFYNVMGLPISKLIQILNS
jgi:septum formation protein